MTQIEEMFAGSPAGEGSGQPATARSRNVSCGGGIQGTFS